jgi:hypothetical protein
MHSGDPAQDEADIPAIGMCHVADVLHNEIVNLLLAQHAVAITKSDFARAFNLLNLFAVGAILRTLMRIIEREQRA